MLDVEILDRIANRFGRTAQAAGDAAADFGQAAKAESGEAASATQDIVLFFLREQRELAALFDTHLVGGQEGVHQRRKESELTMAIAHDRDADQAALAPAMD